MSDAVPDPRLSVEVGAYFLGLPERWMDDPHWRCANGHVRRWFLKSEEHGDLCVSCGEPVRLTFPEDREAEIP